MRRETIEYDTDWVLKDCAAILGGLVLGGAIVASAAAGIRYEIQRELEHMPAIHIDGIQDDQLIPGYDQPESAQQSSDMVSPSSYVTRDSYVVQFA